MKKKIKNAEIAVITEDGTMQLILVDVEKLKQQMKVDQRMRQEGVTLVIKKEGKEDLRVLLRPEEIRSLIKGKEVLEEFVPNVLKNALEDLSQTIVKNQMKTQTMLPIVGRENEIEKVWFYLSQKTRNNVFLVGKTDVGKTAIAKEIARQISTNECPKEFYEKRLIMFDPEKLLKIEKDKVMEGKVKKVFNFLVKNKKKIVLYVDQAIFMKIDYWLIRMLYAVITTYNIPFITTVREEDFENYFLQDSAIAKYVNEVYVKEPEYEELGSMLEGHIERLKAKYRVNITDEMIKFGIYTSCLSESPAYHPGNVISIFEKAFLEAKRKEKKYVDKKSFLSCYNTYIKLYNNTSVTEKRRIAYHETGHYIVAQKCENVKDEKIACVSILPMMDFLGVNWPYKITGKTLNYTREYLIDQIAIYLGGRVGEKIFSATESTGASADLQSATNIALSIVMYYGLSRKDENRNRTYVNDYGNVREYLISNTKKEELDKEVQEIIDEGYELAEKIVLANKKLLEIIAERLLEEEILTGEQLEEICKHYESNGKTSE